MLPQAHDRYIKDYTCEATSSMCVQAQHLPPYLVLSLDHHKNRSIKPVGSYIQAYNSPMPGSGRTKLRICGKECYLQPANSAQWKQMTPRDLMLAGKLYSGGYFHASQHRRPETNRPSLGILLPPSRWEQSGAGTERIRMQSYSEIVLTVSG